MRKNLIVMTVLILLVSACAPQMMTEPPANSDEQPTTGPSEMTPAQSAAITLLSATLNLSADKISLVSTEAVTWPDGCLGVQRVGVMCTQAQVPGYRIVLEADGVKYEVHTDESGESTVLSQDAQLGGIAEKAVISQLAQNLGLKEGDISVVSDVPVQFPDSCLGVAMQDVMCAEVITPGRIIVLEADNIQYEYHVSGDGSRVQPASMALTWKREGGIAGFCDSLTVFLSGEVYGNRCSPADGRMGTFASLLSSSERSRFFDWAARFDRVTIDASDPKGVSDRMLVTLTFSGVGSKSSITGSEQQAMLEFAQSLFNELYSQEPTQ